MTKAWQRQTASVLLPEPVLCTDNAVMVAARGYFDLEARKTAGYDLNAAATRDLGDF